MRSLKSDILDGQLDGLLDAATVPTIETPPDELVGDSPINIEPDEQSVTVHSRYSDKYVTVDTLGHFSRYIIRQAAEEAVVRAEKLRTETDTKRQMIEDKRANHRNLNRMLTLLGALVIGIIVTYSLTHPKILMAAGVAPTTIKFMAPYTFIITVALDSTLALYSFIRHY